MRVKRRMKILSVTAAAASLIGGLAPANAECLSAEVSYRALGGTSQYVVGPKKCVVPTAWPVQDDAWVTPGNPEILQANVHVWLPSPIAGESEEP